MFKLEFDVNNDAFAEDPQAVIAEILTEVGERVVSGTYQGTIHDINGNTIGKFAVDQSDLMQPDAETEA